MSPPNSSKFVKITEQLKNITEKTKYQKKENKAIDLNFLTYPT